MCLHRFRGFARLPQLSQLFGAPAAPGNTDPSTTSIGGNPEKSPAAHWLISSESCAGSPSSLKVSLAAAPKEPSAAQLVSITLQSSSRVGR